MTADRSTSSGVLATVDADAVSDCSPILAIDKWPTNGHLIADCARLGYLRKEWLTLDPTYGYGTFWKVWRPNLLTACDLDPTKSPIGYPVDFTKLPWQDRSFTASVYDGPYKLNGNPSDTGGSDERFGVHVYTRWQDRLDLLVRGAVEVARVTDQYLLVKCQDQVVSGKLRWQTTLIIEALESVGFGLKDRMEFLGRRAQPAGRGQNNAHRASSQLLVFKRGWSWRPEPEMVPTVEGDDSLVCTDREHSRVMELLDNLTQSVAAAKAAKAALTTHSDESMPHPEPS